MSRRIIITIIVLIILIALAIAGYEFALNFTYTRHITLPANLLASSSDADVHAASIASSSTITDILNTESPAFSTIDVSSWRTYSNSPVGYSVGYPADLSVNTDPTGGLILAFPKDRYFHWPLLDDAKVTITASPSCPAVISDMPDSQPKTETVNGYTFTRTEGGDVGAGNIYRELAYDTKVKGVCYHIDFLDHGTNGAGFYVNDQSLIANYDAAHTADLTAVLDVFNAIVNTFRLTENML